MPTLTQVHIDALTPLIDPFEGHPKKTIANLLDGEKHNDEYLVRIHDGRDNSNPLQFTEVTENELAQYGIARGGSFPDKCFLWIIDEVSIKILWEKTPNELRKASRPDRPYVCHTNITGSQKAYIGGEMYFCADGNVYVNFSSDRYGVVAKEPQKKMAIQYMKDCGYKNIVNTEENL